ncbi:hypothetical protein JVT61DRAFT_8224 [Boletus reticuloceps]|uniref:Uncharacterized protein n=1 Tax=Boletus reticuloceps TaxID=495285 RepID=A0A8I2Z0M8_9AGAM|nr:hypothetical protein JVT61DRAFT_8224 [Boletus reticuloceps]
MNMNPVACAVLVLAFSIVRPRSLSKTSALHVRSTSWHSYRLALFPVFLALVAFPASVSAIPQAYTVNRRQGPGPQGSTNNNNNNSPNNGSISMNVWLPILLVTVVFVFFSFITCIRRCAVADAAATASTAANRNASTPAITTRPYRRPRRTPSQISTKSLPAYMKEPGDQELVLFRAPPEMSMDDDTTPPLPMPTLAEDEEVHPEMRDAMFDIPLDRIESVDTMPDSSTPGLIRRLSTSVPRPPELHHASVPHDHRRNGDVHSMDSAGSDVELLAAHQRTVSVDNSADSRGEAPSYTEAVSAEGRMATISLNDPEPNSNVAVPSSLAPGRGRSRFSFLMQNPFGSHNHTSGAPSDANPSAPSIRSESPALHVRSGSALSRLSTHESHDSHHSRNNLARSRSRSNSHLLRAFRSHSPVHAGSSTLSVDSISAPLLHTLTRAEFHVPKGGLTPEQIKLITSREALERFGVPYGPDAVAFSLSRERLAEMRPPPDFESVAGRRQESAAASGSGGSPTEMTAPRSETQGADTALPRSPSPSQSLSPRVDERAGSRTSTVTSYTTAPDDSSRIQIVQTYASDDEDDMDEPRTARPMTPRTARPLSISASGDHGRP